MDFNFFFKKLLEHSIVFVLLLGAVVYIYRYFREEIKDLKEKIKKLENEKEEQNKVILKINGEYHTLLSDMNALTRELMKSFDEVGEDVKEQIIKLSTDIKTFIKVTLLEQQATKNKP